MDVSLPAAVFVTAVVVLSLVSLASASGDYEYWAKAAFTTTVSENWRFTFEERLSFGDEARRLDDHQTDFCFTYWGLADGFGVGLGYKAIFEKDNDNWLVEDRPLLNLIVRTKVRDWGLVSRSRFEDRIPAEDPESWRYRNQVTITPPLTFTPLKIQPYVSDEVFVNFDSRDLCQQRLYGGAYIPLHEKVRLELFYLWKLDEQDDNSWHDMNVLGSYLYLLF